MILPIVTYGNNILRRKCADITADYKDINILLENMWETLHNTKGIGLAAPQINLAIRLFLVDTTDIIDDYNKENSANELPIRKVFINALKTEETGEDKTYNEGCLSIPHLTGSVSRKSSITLSYLDENFEQHQDTFSGIAARVIQHEYDHIDGKLFIDYLTPLEKRLMKGKLLNIAKGNVKTHYKIR